METPGTDDMDLGASGGDSPLDEVAPDPEASLGGVEDVSTAPEGERLGGDGATLDEEELGAPDPEDEGQPVEEAPAPESEPEPAPESEPERVPESEPEPAPESEPKAKGKKSDTRPYTILVENDKGTWEEPDKLKGKKRPVAANGESALRAAYKVLVPSGDDQITMVAISDHYWNPQPVAAKVKEDRAISIG